jgi:hypothetical protein
MSKLIRSRWLRWTLLAGVLIALGCGIYNVQEQEPMCVIDGNTIDKFWLTADGRRLARASHA